MKYFIIFELIVAVYGANHLPSYITLCDSLSPKLATCVNEQIPKIKPHLKNGIKELHIPSLNPLHLSEPVVDVIDGVTVKFANVNIFNLDEFRLNILKANSTFAQYDFLFNRIEIYATVDGTKQDGYSISLSGPIKLYLINYRINLQYNYKPVAENGNVYFHIDNKSTTYISGNIKLQFEGTFANDVIASAIHENWEVFEDFLEPIVTRSLGDIIYGVVTDVTKSIAAASLAHY